MSIAVEFLPVGNSDEDAVIVQYEDENASICVSSMAAAPKSASR